MAREAQPPPATPTEEIINGAELPDTLEDELRQLRAVARYAYIHRLDHYTGRLWLDSIKLQRAWETGEAVTDEDEFDRMTDEELTQASLNDVANYIRARENDPLIQQLRDRIGNAAWEIAALRRAANPETDIS